MRSEGFPKEERVRRSSEFTRIFREGSRVTGQYASAFWIPGPEDGAPVNRVGVAAGKRLGNAVLRNRLKRRMREAYRHNKKELACQGVAVVFVASSRMISCTTRDITEDMRRLLREITRSAS